MELKKGKLKLPLNTTVLPQPNVPTEWNTFQVPQFDLKLAIKAKMKSNGMEFFSTKKNREPITFHENTHILKYSSH